MEPRRLRLLAQTKQNISYEAALGLSHLFNVRLHNDVVRDFDTRWDQGLLAASEIPTEMVWQG